MHETIFHVFMLMFNHKMHVGLLRNGDCGNIKKDGVGTELGELYSNSHQNATCSICFVVWSVSGKASQKAINNLVFSKYRFFFFFPIQTKFALNANFNVKHPTLVCLVWANLPVSFTCDGTAFLHALLTYH